MQSPFIRVALAISFSSAKCIKLEKYCARSNSTLSISRDEMSISIRRWKKKKRTIVSTTLFLFVRGSSSAVGVKNFSPIIFSNFRREIAFEFSRRERSNFLSTFSFFSLLFRLATLFSPTLCQKHGSASDIYPSLPKISRRERHFSQPAARKKSEIPTLENPARF